MKMINSGELNAFVDKELRDGRRVNESSLAQDYRQWSETQVRDPDAMRNYLDVDWPILEAGWEKSELARLQMAYRQKERTAIQPKNIPQQGDNSSQPIAMTSQKGQEDVAMMNDEVYQQIKQSKKVPGRRTHSAATIGTRSQLMDSVLKRSKEFQKIIPKLNGPSAAFDFTKIGPGLKRSMHAPGQPSEAPGQGTGQPPEMAALTLTEKVADKAPQQTVCRCSHCGQPNENHDKKKCQLQRCLCGPEPGHLASECTVPCPCGLEKDEHPTMQCNKYCCMCMALITDMDTHNVCRLTEGISWAELDNGLFHRKLPNPRDYRKEPLTNEEGWKFIQENGCPTCHKRHLLMNCPEMICQDDLCNLSYLGTSPKSVISRCQRHCQNCGFDHSWCNRADFEDLDTVIKFEKELHENCCKQWQRILLPNGDKTEPRLQCKKTEHHHVRKVSEITTFRYRFMEKVRLSQKQGEESSLDFGDWPECPQCWQAMYSNATKEDWEALRQGEKQPTQRPPSPTPTEATTIRTANVRMPMPDSSG